MKITVYFCTVRKLKTQLSVERDEVSEEMSDSRSSMKFGQYGVAKAVYTIIAASNQSHTN